MENFDPTEMAVTAAFSDGSTQDALGYSYPSTDFSTLGEQDVSLAYTYEGVTKSTTLTVTVNPIEVAVPTQKDAITYDGAVKTPIWDGYDSLKMSVSEETTGTNADIYTAKFTLIYGYVFPNESSEAAADWTIDKAVIPSLPVQNNALAADGTPKSPTWDGYDTAQLTIGGDRFGTEAQDYTATFTPTDNYQWWDGTIEAKTASWAIGKGDGVITAVSSNTGVAAVGTISQTTSESTINSVNDTSGTATIKDTANKGSA